MARQVSNHVVARIHTHYSIVLTRILICGTHLRQIDRNGAQCHPD